MNSRHSRTPTRAQSALIHRGPQAMTAAAHVPRADSRAERRAPHRLRQRHDGDPLRPRKGASKPPLVGDHQGQGRRPARLRRLASLSRSTSSRSSEASIDLIFAPAYGSSKKNATDIRLAIDALELVFTRPEIGTFILLSGDSDFSSLVIKLKEYGKYVIGVGIRESSSDLLVQNCDEYYSYNALAGLVKANEDEPARKYDPWELVTEAVQRMKRNNDVMRSDRLKQVMQEIDSTFDEKNLGISKFSRFCQEAAQRGLLSVTKLENGQLEVDLPAAAVRPPKPMASRAETRGSGDRSGRSAVGRATIAPRRSRRGRGGRGRDREDREPRPDRGTPPASSDRRRLRRRRAPRRSTAVAAPAPVPAARDAERRPRDAERQADVPLTSERLLHRATHRRRRRASHARRSVRSRSSHGRRSRAG